MCHLGADLCCNGTCVVCDSDIVIHVLCWPEMFRSTQARIALGGVCHSEQSQYQEGGSCDVHAILPLSWVVDVFSHVAADEAWL